MSQAKKLLLSFLICISLAFSAHASVPSDDDDAYTSVGSNKPLIAQSSAPPLVAQAPPSIVQDTSKTSTLSSNLTADPNTQNLKDIDDFRPYFKYGSLLIKPATFAVILNYTTSYKAAFKSYDGMIALKGWNDQNDLKELLKLLYSFTALKGIKCYKNAWSADTAVKTLGTALQFYPNLAILDLQENALNDKQVTKLLAGKGQNNPASLTSLNIQASSLSPKMLSEIKKKYPNIAEFMVGTETPTAKAEITIEKVEEQKAPSLKPLYSPSSTKEQTPVVTSGTPKTPEIKGEDKRASEMQLTIPLVAKGYEDIYKRFLKGALIYRPKEGSDVGMITLPIAALSNPLEGKFDLSQCGDAGKYLSISTGYRKGKIAENAGKIEIWLAPRFLIEKELQTTASHFKDIMSTWSEKAPVGIFWTWGNWDDLSWYDYLTTQNMDELSNNNLYEKWLHPTRSRHQYPFTPFYSILRRPPPAKTLSKNFMFILN